MPLYELKVSATASILETWHVEASDEAAARAVLDDNPDALGNMDATFIGDEVTGDEDGRVVERVYLVEPETFAPAPSAADETWAILDEMLTYEAAAFGTPCKTCNGTGAVPVGSPIDACEACYGGGVVGADQEVNGADLVQAFAAWRQRLLKARGPVLTPGAFDPQELEMVAACVRQQKGSTIYKDEQDTLERLAVRVEKTGLTPIGWREVISDLMGARDGLDHQVEQMKGMFPDDDGTIRQAQDDGDEAVKRAEMLLKLTEEQKPVTVMVLVSGGVAQSVLFSSPAPGLTVHVVDYDTEGCDPEALATVVDGKNTDTATIETYAGWEQPAANLPTITLPLEA